jgi:thioester reductase-like protein
VPAQSPPTRTILLTGATGFVGMTILRRLLAAGNDVTCLVRADDDAQADARLRAVLARIDAPSTGSARAVAGDVTSERLGLGDRHDELAAQTDTVIHGAASIVFDLPLDEARSINVQGTRRVLDFATAARALERFMHVSTAYVAGDRRGTAYEDDARRGPFRNSYEQTKHEAESLVRGSGLPWTIARPSIVVGESDSGWTSSFNVLYGPLRAFAAGAYRVVPARRRSPVDVVPVDYVADAVVALAEHPEAAGATVHLTAGAGATTVGEIMGLATRGLGRDLPRLVPPRLYPPWVHGLVMRSAPHAAQRLLARSQVYFPYFAMRVRFDDSRARALLGPQGIEVPPLESYFDRLIAFARAARWGRRPLGRVEALELAGEAPDLRAPELSSSRRRATAPAR